MHRIENPLIVGGDQHLVYGLRSLGPFVNVLDHGLSA
jgi:hypothetical protein